MSGPLGIYLKEIAAVPLLTAEQERELAVRCREGDAAARDRLVRANLRYVVSVAKGFRGKGMDLEDLIDEGNLGLIRAVDDFDPGRGFRLTTYARRWIEVMIRRALLDDPRPVRVPRYLHVLLARVRKDPAAADGLSTRNRGRLAEARRALSGAAVGDVTLLAGTAADRGGGEESDGPEIDPATIRAKVEAALHVLNQRERVVFARCHGFMGRTPRSVSTVAWDLKLPIRTVEARLARALRKLRRELGGESDAGLPPIRAVGKLDGRARVDPKVVPAIRDRFGRGESGSRLAREFGLDRTTIARIVARPPRVIVPARRPTDSR